MPIIQPEFLGRVYRAIALALGAPDEDADILARCFLDADLRGKDTQGIVCVPVLLSWTRSGALRFGARLKIVREGPSFAVVDGGHGPGQVNATRAMEIAIRKAREVGTASVWVRNTNDCTMMANYAMQALEHNCIGIAMSNGTGFVAPWGGRDSLFGTNPFALAIPAGRERAIVIDASTSAMSHGKVVLAARDGKHLKHPVLVDEEGRITNDPAPVVTDVTDRFSPQTGSILPFDHKTYGFLLLVEVFAGILPGLAGSREVPLEISAEHPCTMGHCLMAIDVSQLMPLEEYHARIDALITSIRTTRPAQGFEEVLVPGEGAARVAERRRREGIPVRDEDWANLEAMARELNLDLEALRASAG